MRAGLDVLPLSLSLVPFAKVAVSKRALRWLPAVQRHYQKPINLHIIKALVIVSDIMLIIIIVSYMKAFLLTFLII